MYIYIYSRGGWSFCAHISPDNRESCSEGHLNPRPLLVHSNVCYVLLAGKIGSGGFRVNLTSAQNVSLRIYIAAQLDEVCVAKIVEHSALSLSLIIESQSRTRLDWIRSRHSLCIRSARWALHVYIYTQYNRHTRKRAKFLSPASGWLSIPLLPLSSYYCWYIYIYILLARDFEIYTDRYIHLFVCVYRWCWYVRGLNSIFALENIAFCCRMRILKLKSDPALSAVHSMIFQVFTSFSDLSLFFFIYYTTLRLVLVPSSRCSFYFSRFAIGHYRLLLLIYGTVTSSEKEVVADNAHIDSLYTFSSHASRKTNSPLISKNSNLSSLYLSHEREYYIFADIPV